MTISIICLSIGLIVFFIGLIIGIIRTDDKPVIIGFLVSCLFISISIMLQSIYNTEKTKNYCIEHIIEYKIDSTIVINSNDTTKTYTITYHL